MAPFIHGSYVEADADADETVLAGVDAGVLAGVDAAAMDVSPRGGGSRGGRVPAGECGHGVTGCRCRDRPPMIHASTSGGNKRRRGRFLPPGGG